MAAYDPGRYGSVVGDYDALYPGNPVETAAAIDLLTHLATRHPERSLVEFGIGTGRLALGVARRGIRTLGIDGSTEMVAQLRAKPGGSDIEIAIGDYRDATVGGRHSVVVLAFNGIFDPRGVGAQLDIFANAARHLVPGGRFVVESWVMHDRDRTGDWSVVPRYVGDEHVELQLARYDIDTNRIERTLVHIRSAGTDFVTVSDTYASPGALDVMAEATGFDRVARYASWTETPFTALSSRQVSVYARRV